MEELRLLLEETISENLMQIIISNKKVKGGVKKIHIRPILLKDDVSYQVAEYTEKQVFHKNLTKDKAINAILSYMEEYKQLELETDTITAFCLVSKKGKMTIKRKNKGKNATNRTGNALSHNRKKEYILDSSTPIPFLQDLGIQNGNGNIVNSKYDKWKQISRFLEFI